MNDEEKTERVLVSQEENLEQTWRRFLERFRGSGSDADLRLTYYICENDDVGPNSGSNQKSSDNTPLMDL